MISPLSQRTTGHSSALLEQLPSPHKNRLLLGQRVVGAQNVPCSAHSPDGQRNGACAGHLTSVGQSAVDALQM